MVIVTDKYVEMKNEGKIAGMVRIVVYLEDLGVVRKQERPQTGFAPIQASNSVED